MKKLDFNQGWFCRCLTREEGIYSVTLPHDAMRTEPRTNDSAGEGNIGWYIGGTMSIPNDFPFRRTMRASPSCWNLKGSTTTPRSG